ncbi:MULTISPECIES: DUF4059 family protein [unclassified Streptococcus]|uniref:DUF4059 family protein n=1 Tax=unclassified Streptococcus TaxID=2608887 RepID=UPI001072D2DB|nr:MULTISPECIES: DUF4059 family protein [unclassified Streptococcus]MBF0805536.1 DUF4059 family protein [Streptococcus sp. 19428wA2_WM07]TFU28989.1 DUF4059 family protein [Streptococcus sp. WM07]
MLAQMLTLYFQSLLLTSAATFLIGLVFYVRGVAKGNTRRQMRHEVLITSCLVVPIFSFAVMALLIVF